MASPSTPAITADGLQKRYGAVQAVDGVSLEIRTGEFFGLLGPNGAGKTTTLEILEGLRKPDAGRARVLGEPPWPRNPRLLPRIGVQLQASAFFDRLTAREQLAAFAQLYGVGTRQAEEMLARVGLGEFGGTLAERLSGGQAQRLSIACALVHEPELVFLDEPTTGLDPQARRNLWDLLREINADGRTVVLTTHYLDEAEILCDRVAVMDHGRILRTGAPAALVRALDAPTRITVPAGALSPDVLAEARAELDGRVEITEDEVSLVFSTRDPAPVLALLTEHGALHGLEARGGTLEDVFLDLTGREYRE